MPPQALELAVEDRESYLEAECGQDQKLLEAVREFMERVGSQNEPGLLEEVIEESRLGWSNLIEQGKQPTPALSPDWLPGRVGALPNHSAQSAPEAWASFMRPGKKRPAARWRSR